MQAEKAEKAETNLHTSYNCVLASVYNILVNNAGLTFPFACLCVSPQFFKLEAVANEPLLVSEHPEQTMLHFLRRIGAEAVYPNIGSVDDAPAFAEAYLAKHAVLPFFINLRYSVLDPAPYDNDYWNVQLLVGRDEAHGHWLAYDTFHGESYTLEQEQFRMMIDTPFNYRMDSGFSPFLTIELGDLEGCRRELNRMTEASSIIDALTRYPLEANLEAGQSFVTQLRTMYMKDDGRNLHDEIYKIIGFQRILIKQREQIGAFAETLGYTHAHRFRELAQAWDTFSYGIAMAISRHEREGFDKLAVEFEALIRREFEEAEELGAWLKLS